MSRIDDAIYEAMIPCTEILAPPSTGQYTPQVFNLMEGIVPEFDRKGAVRGPSGSTVTGIVPTNTYRCADGQRYPLLLLLGTRAT